MPLRAGRLLLQVVSRSPVKVRGKLWLKFTILLAECTLGLSRTLMAPFIGAWKCPNGSMDLPIVIRRLGRTLLLLFPGSSRLPVCRLVTALLVTTWVVVPVSVMLAVPEVNGMAWEVCGPVLTIHSAPVTKVHRMPTRFRMR